jgi:hypothetical protein
VCDYRLVTGELWVGSCQVLVVYRWFNPTKDGVWDTLRGMGGGTKFPTIENQF